MFPNYKFTKKQVDILEIAEKLFAERGYDGTSIRDIAKEAHINIAMISYYFGSKEKLLEGIVIYRSENLEIQVTAIAKEERNPLEKMNKLIDFFIHLVHKNRCIYQILNTEFNNQKRALNLEIINQSKINNFKLLEKIILEGQEQGIFKKEIYIPLIIPTIVGTYFYFVTNLTYHTQLLQLNSDNAIEHYIHNDLIIHIKQTIKSLISI